MTATLAAPVEASVEVQPSTPDRAVVVHAGRMVGHLQRYPLRGRNSWYVQVGPRLCSDLSYHEAARLAGVLYRHPSPMCRTDLEPASPPVQCRCNRTKESADVRR